MKPAGPTPIRLAVGAFSLVCVLVLVASPAATAAGVRAPTDTVFLVDSSGSNFRSDPEGARKLLLEAFASFAWNHPGDRIGVGQFAGWEETYRSNNVVFALKRIPEDEQERSKFIDEFRAGLQGMKPFGVGTDPNAALDLVLPQIEKQGGAGEVPEVPEGEEPPPRNRLWAVIVTDGDVNVVEGATARDVYIARAEKDHGTATPETLALVASDIFFNETLPRMKERGATVTPIGLGCKADDPGPFFERLKETTDTNVLCVESPLLCRTFTSLLKSYPGRDPSETSDYGYSLATVDPGATHRIAFRVLPETLRTRAVFFGSNGEYDVSVGKPGGGKVGAEATPKGQTGGKGAFRILEFTAAAPGDYEFIVKSTSEAEAAEAKGPLMLEVTLYPEVALDVSVGDTDGVFTSPAGWPFKCVVSVTGADGEVVENPLALPELNVALELSDAAVPGEAPLAQEVTFRNLPRAEAGAEFAVSEVGTARRRVAVRLRAFPVEAEGEAEGEKVQSYIYEGPLKLFDLDLVPAVAVEFGLEELEDRPGFVEAFAGQVVPLAGSCTVPVDLPPEEVVAVIAPDMTVTLARVSTEEGDRFEGSVAFPRAGEWHIARSETPETLVVSGPRGAVSVRDRRMLILSVEPPHEPLAGLEFTVRYHEAWGPYEVPVLLDLDVGPGEVPEFPSSSFEPSDELAKLGIESPFKIEIRPQGDVEPGGRRVRAVVALTVTTDEALPKAPGSAALAAKLGELSLARSVPVTLAFSDYWKKIILMYWYYWGPALLVLLLILWWLLLARFSGQQIYLVTRLDQQTAPFHLLRDLCEGSKRQAFGTPEVENVAQFRIKGSKLGGGRVSARILREGATVAANGVAASDWVRLYHGDEVIAENPEGAYCRYWYFDHAPSEEELTAMLAADAVELGPDEFVIEGL